MNEILDKSFLFVCTIILYVETFKGNYIMFPILLALLFACLMIYLENRLIKNLLFSSYLLLCTLLPQLTMFLPIFMYDYFWSKFYYFLLFILYIMNFNYSNLGMHNTVYIILFTLLSFYLKSKTSKHKHLQVLHKQSLNDSKELVLIEEEKNRSILENQDYEINIATLSERNRISKEIHDHIGHVLSRSLIQIGALLTLEKDPLIKDELNSLKLSLSEGMDSIRASIHNMHDESIDLYSTILNLVKEFQFCEIRYQYDIVNPPLLKVKYCFIAIVKEALANIMKHSSATKVIIVIAEEPALYRLIIEDNGEIDEKTKALARRVQLSNDYVEGMGLQNMIERVKGFNGNFQIVADNGFKIFISIPKEKDGG